jgi:hypothetical protein
MPETGARIATWPQFSAGLPVNIDSIGLTRQEQEIRMMRALSQVGRLPYTRANCDVLATYAETGRAWSPQLVGGLALAALIGLAVWSSRD